MPERETAWPDIFEFWVKVVMLGSVMSMKWIDTDACLDKFITIPSNSKICAYIETTILAASTNYDGRGWFSMYVQVREKVWDQPLHTTKNRPKPTISKFCEILNPCPILLRQLEWAVLSRFFQYIEYMEKFNAMWKRETALQENLGGSYHSPLVLYRKTWPSDRIRLSVVSHAVQSVFQHRVKIWYTPYVLE
jgi:hypothetical protein